MAGKAPKNEAEFAGKGRQAKRLTWGQWVAGKVMVTNNDQKISQKRRKGRQKAEAGCRNKCNDQKGPSGTIGPQ